MEGGVALLHLGKGGGDVHLPGPVAADLIRAGLLVGEGSEGAGRLRMTDASLSIFLPLLTAFNVRLVPVAREGCPVHFCSGILKTAPGTDKVSGNPTSAIPAGGQGAAAIYAALSCLGEISERLSLCTHGINDSRILVKENLQPEVAFFQLLGLSRNQEQQLAGKMRLRGTVSDDRPDWEGLSERRIQLRSIDGRATAQFPSFGVLFNEMELIGVRGISLASSAGCAVWRDLEGARERALLELVERDAVAQAWYNRVGITSLDRAFLREILPAPLFSYLADRPRHWSLFLVATDLDAFVVMALSHEHGGRRAALGTSAGWDIASAGESAIQEMLQSEYALELMENAHRETGRPDRPSSPVPRQLAYARQGNILEDLSLLEAPSADERQLRGSASYENLLQSCFDKGFEIWEFEATRQDLNIPCIKLLSPDLCSWEPRFGKRRLFEGVVQRGLRATPATEAEFAARPFPF